VGVAGQQQRALRRVAPLQLAQLALQPRVRVAHGGALGIVERRGVAVEFHRRGPQGCEGAAGGRAREDVGRAARPGDRGDRALGARQQRQHHLVVGERVGGLAHQVEQPHQFDDGGVLPHEPGAAQPGVGLRHAEGLACDRVGLDGEARAAQREAAVVRIEAEALVPVGEDERQERLAAEVELEARLVERPAGGHLDVGMRQADDAVAPRPGVAEGERRPLEGPGVEVDVGAVAPAGEGGGAHPQAVAALGGGEGHAGSSRRTDRGKTPVKSRGHARRAGRQSRTSPRSAKWRRHSPSASGRTWASTRASASGQRSPRS
jgi:hypothetical protein